MSNWNDYTYDDAQKGAGGDWPDIPDDLYDARVMDVSEPETKSNPFRKKDTDPETQTQFYLTWELLPTPQQIEDGCPDGSTLRQYLNIPDRFIREGYLGEKAKLYGVMTALGFDLEQPFRFAPPEWIDLRARVLVEHVESNDGSTRSRITKVQPPRQRAAAAARPAASRQPVGAAAGRAPLRQRLEDEGE